MTIDTRHDRPGSRKARLHAVTRATPDLGLRDDVHLLTAPVRNPLGLNPPADTRLTARQAWAAYLLGIPGPIPELRDTFVALVPDRFKGPRQ